MDTKKILVVDDEEVVRVLFEHAFTKKGYTVRSAGSAEEALDILNEERFPVVFIDLKLPGMSGIELCREIHNISPMFVTYAVTAYASLFEASDCREAGFDDYFIKPVDNDLLYKAAEIAFEKVSRWTKRYAT